jgi:uncharacterized protein
MRPLRVVVDPNVLISLLIGKRIVALVTLFHDPRFQVIVDSLLLDELDQVARRPKFKKLFPVEKVDELVYLVERTAEILSAGTEIKAVSRDPADDYLLDLCKRAKARLLLTGDEDLLVLGKHGRTRIIAPRAFVTEFLT